MLKLIRNYINPIGFAVYSRVWFTEVKSNNFHFLAYIPQSTHREATTVWRAFHHDGKISPSW
jgi:hypothetical protein